MINLKRVGIWLIFTLALMYGISLYRSNHVPKINGREGMTIEFSGIVRDHANPNIGSYIEIGDNWYLDIFSVRGFFPRQDGTFEQTYSKDISNIKNKSEMKAILAMMDFFATHCIKDGPDCYIVKYPAMSGLPSVGNYATIIIIGDMVTVMSGNHANKKLTLYWFNANG